MNPDTLGSKGGRASRPEPRRRPAVTVVLSLLGYLIALSAASVFAQARSRAGISLDVWGQTDSRAEFKNTDFDIRYSAREESGIVVLSPRSRYLHSYFSDGTVAGFMLVDPSDPLFNLSFPVLDFKIVNNSSATAAIHQVVLEVESSHTDPSPLLVPVCRSEDLFHFELRNEGWSSAEDVRLRFEVYDRRFRAGSRGSLGTESSLPYSTGPFSVERSHKISIERILMSQGVDTASIAFLYRGGDLHSERVQQRILQALGPYRSSGGGQDWGAWNRIAEVDGVLSFRGLMPNGSWRSFRLKFSVPVPISPPSGIGGPLPTAASYDLLLDMDRSHYRKGVSFFQALPGGGAYRFGIRVGTLRSSVHDLRARIVLDDGEILSRPVRLWITVPRTNARHLAMGYR